MWRHQPAKLAPQLSDYYFSWQAVTVSLRAKCRHVHSEWIARSEKLNKKKKKRGSKLKITKGRHSRSSLGKRTKGLPVTMDDKAPRVEKL